MKYFVKLVGRAFGPLEEEKIVEMYQAGRLIDPVEISRDKKTWDSIDVILPKAEPAVESQPPAIPVAFSDDSLLPDYGNSLLESDDVLHNDVSPNMDDINSPVWFYSVDGLKGYGPVTKSDIATMLQCGMIQFNSIVWRQGENSRPITAVPELRDCFTSENSKSSFEVSDPSVPPLPDALAYNESPSSYSPSSYSIQNQSAGTFHQNASADFRTHSNANRFNQQLDPMNQLLEEYGQGNSYNHSNPGNTSRASYLLLALFLGQLGVHNFYANRMDIAIVQLFIGLSNLVGLIVITFVSLFTEGEGYFLFLIPAVIALGLEVWAIIEMCTVTNDGNGKLMV